MVSRGALWLLMLLVLAATGCSPGAKLVGKWEVDASQAQAGSGGNPLGALASGMLSMVSVETEFKSDGTCSVSSTFLGQATSKSGKWRYVKTEGDELVLMIQIDGTSTEREVRARFTDYDHVQMSPPGLADATQVSFKRVKPT